MVKVCGTPKNKQGENFPYLRAQEDPDHLGLLYQVTYADGGQTSKFVIQYEIMQNISKC